MEQPLPEADRSFMRYVRHSWWVVLIFWGASYALGTVFGDDAIVFLTLPLPVLFLISQLLINLYIVPFQSISVLRRAGAVLAVAAIFSLVSILVLWPFVSSMPWGFKWTSYPQVRLVLALTWLAGYLLTYGLIVLRWSAHQPR